MKRTGDRDYRQGLLVAAICLAALAVHARSLISPHLYYDDFDIITKSYTWQSAWAHLWIPVNEHVWPLMRLWTWLVVQASGQASCLPLAAAVATRLLLLFTMLLVYRFVRRECNDPLLGLVAMAWFGISSVYYEAVYWYAASPALGSLGTGLLSLIAAQNWRRTGSKFQLILSGGWASLSPAWFAGGILIGPLASFYLVIPSPSDSGIRDSKTFRRWAFIVPWLGTAAFLAVSLPGTATHIMRAHHYGGKTAIEAFDPLVGVANTARASVDCLVVGSFGIGSVVLPIAMVVAVLTLLAFAGAWWWKKASHRGMILLGLAFIVSSYLLVFSARADRWSYETQLAHWTRYNVYPQFGLTLIICGGLPQWRRQVSEAASLEPFGSRETRVLTVVILVLLVTHTPRGLIGLPAPDPQETQEMQRLERLDRARGRA